MKHKTDDLTGARLDEAVALALVWETDAYGAPRTLRRLTSGTVVVFPSITEDDNGEWWNPSEQWSQGGPLIETHGISIIKDKDDGIWYAGPEYWIQGGFDGEYAIGPTPLIAAMRAFCAAKLGDEVELP